MLGCYIQGAQTPSSLAHIHSPFANKLSFLLPVCLLVNSFMALWQTFSVFLPNSAIYWNCFFAHAHFHTIQLNPIPHILAVPLFFCTSRQINQSYKSIINTLCFLKIYLSPCIQNKCQWLPVYLDWQHFHAYIVVGKG